MATKRKLEFEDYSKVCDEVGSADLHGVVTNLSPIKKSKKGNMYDHGELSDGKRSLRFVGFASTQQKILHDFLEKRQSVEFGTVRLILRSDRVSDKTRSLCFVRFASTQQKIARLS